MGRDDSRPRSPARRGGGRSRSRSRRGNRSRSRRRPPEDDKPAASTGRRRSSWWDKEDTGGVAALPEKQVSNAAPASTAVPPIIVSGPSLNLAFCEAAPAHLGEAKCTIEVHHQYASYVIGKTCESIRPVEAATGAMIKLDHSQGLEGPTQCRIYGDAEVVGIAEQLIRVRLANVDGTATKEFAAEKIDIEHAHVFKILGKDGEAVKQLGIDTGASVTFMRGSAPASEGADALHISGRKDQVDVAMRLVRKRLDDCLTLKFGPEISASNPAETSCDIEVEQQFIGWIMGKAKQNIREIADQTGAFVQVKQATKEQGHSIIKISGGQRAVDAARVRIVQRTEQGRRYQDDKKAQFMAGDWLCPSCGDQQFRRNDVCRRCGTHRPQEAQENPQGSQGTFLRRDCDDAFMVEQRYVGFIIGPGGSIFREIKEKSGAKLYVDQETRDQGFSIVRVGDKGTPENRKAIELIEQKIDEGLASKQRMQTPQADAQMATAATAATASSKAAARPPQGAQMADSSMQGWQPAGNGEQWGSNGQWGGQNGSGDQWGSQNAGGQWGCKGQGKGGNWDMPNAGPTMNTYSSDPAWNGANGGPAPLSITQDAAPAMLDEDTVIEMLGPIIVDAMVLGTQEEQLRHFHNHLEPLRPRITNELYEKCKASFEAAI